MLFVHYHRWTRTVFLYSGIESMLHRLGLFPQNTPQGVFPLSSDDRTEFVSESFYHDFEVFDLFFAVNWVSAGHRYQRGCLGR